jgi:hypothetical protein
MDVTTLIRRSITVIGGAVVSEVLPLVYDFERQVVGAIRQHLDQLDLPDNSAANDAAGQSDDHRPPTDILQSLLDRSIYNMPDDSRNDLYRTLLQALLPDEARILAALSDGSPYPLLHIAEPSAGGNSVMALENASTVGRIAGVSLLDRTPLYLTRMLQLGLVAIGPEGSSSMDSDYEMLLAEDAVTVAQASARRGIIGARVIRRTVRITALGREMWEAAK